MTAPRVDMSEPHKARVIARMQLLASLYVMDQSPEHRRCLEDADIDYSFSLERTTDDEPVFQFRARADAALADGPERLVDVPADVVGVSLIDGQLVVDDL